MLHEIAPHCLNNEYRPREAQNGDYVLYFTQRELALADGKVPTLENYATPGKLQYLFSLDEKALFLSENPPENAEMVPHRAIRQMEQPFAFAIGTALHLYGWYDKTRFCGRCGAKMEHSVSERAMTCPACGNTVYPRINPAVIVAVVCGNKLLMAQGVNMPEDFYSLVAGYLEIGESMEQCVIREVYEETGVHVRNVRFLKNQPWPFTETFMVGFVAEADDTEPICVQENEIRDAKWFDRDSLLPRTPDSVAIASTIIAMWQRHEF